MMIKEARRRREMKGKRKWKGWVVVNLRIENS
jgi:hypothetical protein